MCAISLAFVRYLHQRDIISQSALRSHSHEALTLESMPKMNSLQDGSLAVSGSSKMPERVDATASNSTAAVECPDAPKVEFNYKYPALQADGTVIIETNFNDREKESKVFMTARNCEVPLELKQRGRLPDEVDQKIQFRRCRAREPVFVLQDGHKNYNAEFFGEEQIHAIPEVESSINRVREMLFKRNETFPDQSDFEMILAGTKSKLKPSDRRAYGLGFTLDQNGQTISGYTLNNRMVQNKELLAEFHKEAAFIATSLLESSSCPKETLELVRKQHDRNTPCTFGSEDNKYFTATQLNFSPVLGNSTDLTLTIGEVGGHHADSSDDPALWTVLVNFSNLPKGMDPGRMILTGLRVYADMGPNTAFIFKGVHTHLPLAPGPMGDSTNAPYVTKYVPDLDPEKYIYGRVMNVNYPKKLVMDQSAFKIRTITPKYLTRSNGLICNSPDFLPDTSAVWGTKRNAMESKARISALNLTRASRLDPDQFPPTAEAIASLHRWREGDTTYTPRFERIQAVIDANMDTEETREHNRKWAEYANSCERQISQVMFQKPGKAGAGSKSGPTNWVEELGSSLIGLSKVPEAPARRRQKNGQKKDDALDTASIPGSHKCPQCESRFLRSEHCHEHFKQHHGREFEWRAPGKTPDPKKAVSSGEPKDAKGEASAVAVVEGVEQKPQARKRKRFGTGD
ncbi:hypothetical protein BKA64DRAFT_725340 [Cadophora sp. MPI-SDFR-AT-0126]|nr:hypothetical protein BKA64DRAFT_725340 [Leotiomycetes sp. MPI-SDFR-AT-0126]